jgi:hypothetical protein
MQLTTWLACVLSRASRAGFREAVAAAQRRLLSL